MGSRSTNLLESFGLSAPVTTPWKLTAQSASVETEGIVLMHVILRTAPEGEPISQLADGSIRLRTCAMCVFMVPSFNTSPCLTKIPSVIRVNESDQPSWFFQCLRPGRYAVVILQGCGKGHGGSPVHPSIDQTHAPFSGGGNGSFPAFCSSHRRRCGYHARIHMN